MTIGTTYNWNFGDRSGATGNIVSKIYSSPGIYGSRLTARNAWGTRTSQTKYIEVISGITFSQILTDYVPKGGITGPLELGTFSQGNTPIVATDYFYSSGGPSDGGHGYYVNRMYVVINPSVGAMGGTVYCMSPTASYNTILKYTDLDASVPTTTGRRSCIFQDLKYGVFVNKVVPGITTTPLLVYKGILRTPLENSDTIIEILDPSVRIPREVSIGGVTFVQLPSFSKLKLNESRSGITAQFLLDLQGSTFEVRALAICSNPFFPCPNCGEDESPGGTGPVLATYRIQREKAFQRRSNGDFIMDTVSAQNGDQLKIFGEYLFPAVNIYGGPGTTTAYKNAGKVDGVRIANYMEYMLPFSKNKKNIINMTSFGGMQWYRGTAGPNGTSFGAFYSWHVMPETQANSYKNISGYQYLSDLLLTQDSIQVENPITGEISDSIDCLTHTTSCEGGTAPVNGMPVPVNVKFVALGYTMGRKYLRDRVYHWWSEVYPRLTEVGVKINSVNFNIADEGNRMAPLRKAYLTSQHLPMINDRRPSTNCHNGFSCMQPNNYGVLSLNPYQVSDGPGAPNSVERLLVTEPYNWNINPYNPYFKNWLRAHLNNPHTQSILYEFLSYVKGFTVDANNVEEFIRNNVYAFTKPGVWFYDDLGYIQGGNITYPRGWTMEYFYGQAACGVIDSKVYSAFYDVVRGGEGISGFPDISAYNYDSACLSPRGSSGVCGTTYSDAISFYYSGTPNFDETKVGNVGTIQWYGNTIRSHLAYIYGSWRFFSQQNDFNIKNIPYYPLPSPVIVNNVNNTIYDKLSQKTFPFWSIVFNVNNFRAAWRVNPEEKKVAFLSPFSESVSTIRDRIYRLEYNIHGLLHSSDDVIAPYFAASSGKNFSDVDIQDSLREVNKVLQNNRKRLFTKDVYGYTYMSPSYLKRGSAGDTFGNIKNLPPLVTGVEFGGTGATYDYLAYRITVPLPRIQGPEYIFDGNAHGYYDFGATLSGTDTYPNIKYFDIKVLFPNGTSATIPLGLTSAGVWYLAPNNITYQNVQFKLI
jgi:hypothetical protein